MIFYAQTWEIPENKKALSGELVLLDGKKSLGSPSFVNYIFSQQKTNNKTKPIASLVDNLLEKMARRANRSVLR